MKIRAQIGMVLNLDKCIGCHTCSVTVQERLDRAAGHGIRLVQQRRDQARHRLSREWENQDKWNGGWVRKPAARSSRARVRSGSC